MSYASYIPLIPLLPLASFLLLSFLGKKQLKSFSGVIGTVCGDDCSDGYHGTPDVCQRFPDMGYQYRRTVYHGYIIVICHWNFDGGLGQQQ